jgi:hypothetical protein
MDYSIVDFAKSLRVDRCRIKNTPNLIFLCGGKVTESGDYKSARDYFYRHLRRNVAGIAGRVRLAEVVNAWFRKSPFPDLLELENYLADLADITVLFVESPGSIAELGAFAASDRLRPRTLAVLNENLRGSEPSFISEGPVQKITNESSDLVHYYDWDQEHLNSTSTKRDLREMADGITEFLIARDKSHPKEQSFDRSKHGHVLLIVADLIRIAGVTTTTDISSCLKELGSDSDQAQMARYFWLLESMSFIKLVRRSSQTFYVTNSSKSFMRYAYQPGVSLRDQNRIKAAIRSSLEPIRKKVLAKSLAKATRSGVLGV